MEDEDMVIDLEDGELKKKKKPKPIYNPDDTGDVGQ